MYEKLELQLFHDFLSYGHKDVLWGHSDLHIWRNVLKAFLKLVLDEQTRKHKYLQP